jgi:hypothetical protein
MGIIRNPYRPACGNGSCPTIIELFFKKSDKKITNGSGLLK